MHNKINAEMLLHVRMHTIVLLSLMLCAIMIKMLLLYQSQQQQHVATAIKLSNLGYNYYVLS